MTTLGKTLTVIIVLLSICLMMFAGAVYKSGRGWRTEADGLRKQLNDTNNNLTQAQKELESVKTKLTQERDAQKDTANEALASLNELKDDYEEQENLLTNARQERDVAVRQSEIANQEAEFKRQEAEALREANAKLQQDTNELSQKNRELNDEIYNRELEIAEVTEKHTRLVDQYATLQEVLAHNNIDPDPAAHKGLTSPPPVVEGLVLDTRTITRSNTTLVNISIGSDDGLAVGHTMYVYRPQAADGTPAQYLGKLKITRVTPDQAVGELVLASKNGIIARGDNVTTKL